jgi:pilus assembly protein CpaE
MEPIRILATVDAGVNPEIVQSLLAVEPAVQILVMAEGLDAEVDPVAEQSADLHLVACDVHSDRVLSFIGGSVKQHPERPVVVLSADVRNGFVRRVFEAGADDIITVGHSNPGNGMLSEEIIFTLQKTMARRRGTKGGGRGVRGAMICVLGPKGGIGKTLTSSNLAVALVAQGSTAVVVDVDLQFGDVALALGLAPEKTIYDLVTSSGALDDEKLDAFLAVHESGVRVLVAPTRPDQASAITAEFLREVYAVLRSTYDYVVVDTPPGFTPEVIASIDTASDIVMVGMLDSLSLKNTKLGLETLDLMGVDVDRQVKLVLNRADSRVGITRDDVTEIVGRSPDVMVPSHRDIARLVNEGRAVVAASPRSEAAKAFAGLARGYARPVGPAPATKTRRPRHLIKRKA